MTPDEAAQVLAFSDEVRARYERPTHQVERIARTWAPYLDGVTFEDCKHAIEDLEMDRVGNDRRRGDNVFHIAARAKWHRDRRESEDRAARFGEQS